MFTNQKTPVIAKRIPCVEAVFITGEVLLNFLRIKGTKWKEAFFASFVEQGIVVNDAEGIKEKYQVFRMQWVDNMVKTVINQLALTKKALARRGSIIKPSTS